MWIRNVRRPAGPSARWAITILCVVLACCAPTLAQAPTPPQNYRLQPGDEISIIVSPRPEFGGNTIIAPDGLIFVRNAGAIRAAGLTGTELAARIRKSLEKELKRPTVTVSLLKLGLPPMPPRPRVTVVGAVGKSGPVDLEEGLRLRKALDLAGGATPMADLTRVTVIRKDLTRTIIDLSDPAATEDPKRNVLLADGDSIEVPQQEVQQVAIAGAVHKPGPVPLTPGLRLRAAIGLVGGATQEADLRRVKLVRKDLSQQVLDFSQPEAPQDETANPLLQNGDSVEVPYAQPTGEASIRGAVLKPGTYPLQQGWTLDDLIMASGKLTLIADLERIQFRRHGQEVRTLNLIALQEKGVDGKITLLPGDEFFVPEQKDRVLVIGPIPNPGYRALKPGQTLREFLSTGPETLATLDTSKADLKNARLIRDGQETLKLNLNELLAKPKYKHNVTLRSGDVLFIPPIDTQRSPSAVDYIRALPFIGGLARLLGP